MNRFNTEELLLAFLNLAIGVMYITSLDRFISAAATCNIVMALLVGAFIIEDYTNEKS